MTDGAARIRDEALDVLRDVLCWELAPARWQQLAEILEAADSAQASGDLDALATATEQRELVGPVRITRVGATPPGAVIVLGGYDLAFLTLAGIAALARGLFALAVPETSPPGAVVSP